jgi:hypothetical protein
MKLDSKWSLFYLHPLLIFCRPTFANSGKPNLRKTSLKLVNLAVDLNSLRTRDFYHQRPRCRNYPQISKLSKSIDMTIHWKALEEHFLMVPLVLWWSKPTDMTIHWKPLEDHFPISLKMVKTHWHDHSLESSRGALSDGTISLWIESGKTFFEICAVP